MRRTTNTSDHDALFGLGLRFLALLGCCFGNAALGLAAEGGDQTDAANPALKEHFEATIRPVLIEHCYECHSAEIQEAGLNLEFRQSTRKGGDSGPAVVPGKPKASLLLQAIRYDGEIQMPHDQKLPASVVQSFETWIRQGALDPRERPPSGDDSAESTALAESNASNHSDGAYNWAQARGYWAFQPIRRQQLPDVQHRRWPQRRHDYFVLAKLERQGMGPAGRAATSVLAKRLAFDLTGLPLRVVAPNDWGELLSERASDSKTTNRFASRIAALVDQLLASPHFGERWARMWMDLARYAEDQAHIVGNNKSLFYPNAYLYRDWLIQAFNQDLPYDQFVTQQLAADLLAENGDNEALGRNETTTEGDAAEQRSGQQDPEDNRDLNRLGGERQLDPTRCGDDLAALGFLGLGPKYYNRGRLEVKAQEWEDRVDTVTRTLLGLTVACARCHDHKYDPIPTSDYYALASIFASTEMYNRPLYESAKVNGRGQAKDPDQAMHIVRDGEPKDLPVFIRGRADAHGESTQRGFLTVLGSDGRAEFQHGSGRLELARAIVANDNPLTARVIVNRVWGELIGEPIVGTPSNFGQLGQRPSHPRLLDDLAHRFVENGWSLKWLIREIVTSATYQQTSFDDAHLAEDPENRWLSRMHRKRLPIEAWRDRLLAASGQLSNRVGGDSIRPDQPASKRRTVYAAASRFELNPMLATFDLPDPNVHSARRVPTTTPQQRLFALNHPFVIRQAELLAQKVLSQFGDSDEPPDFNSTIQFVYARVFGRRPTNAEMQIARNFFTGTETTVAAFSDQVDPVHEVSVKSASEPRERSALANDLPQLQQWIHALLASNEMLFLD